MSRHCYSYFLKASNKLAPNTTDIKSDKLLLIILFFPIQVCQKYFIFTTAWIFRGAKQQQFLTTSEKNQAINKRIDCIMFSAWLDLPAPQYQLSSLKSTFLVGNRPVNVCKKLDVSVCEDIRLQLRSVAYGVEMNEWWQDIKVCCGWVLQLKDNVRLQKYCSNCRLLLSLHLFMHSQTLTHLQIWFKQNDSTFYWFKT